MSYAIHKLPVGDVPAAQAVVNAIQSLYYYPHPVLKELRRDVFYGGHVWVMYNERGQPVSVNCTKPGKRRKNIWEPYANWYTAYTVVPLRRQGLALQLYKHVEAELEALGCRRIKSLAGSSAGLALHRAAGHDFWGCTDNNEVYVDAPLPGSRSLYEGKTPPQVPGKRLNKANVAELIKKGLRYDHG